MLDQLNSITSIAWAHITPGDKPLPPYPVPSATALIDCLASVGVEAEAEGVPGRVEQHPDVGLRLLAASVAPSFVASSTASSRSATSKSKCIIGRCSPSTGGQTGCGSRRRAGTPHRQPPAAEPGRLSPVPRARPPNRGGRHRSWRAPPDPVPRSRSPPHPILASQHLQSLTHRRAPRSPPGNAGRPMSTPLADALDRMNAGPWLPFHDGS